MAYFVLDGLDECEDIDKEEVCRFLQKLQERFTILLCFSYRTKPITPEQWTSEPFCLPSIATIPTINPDIDAFIEAELERCLESGSLVLGDPMLILDIQTALSERSQGMFLWVALQIRVLSSMKTDQAIRDALNDLPRDLSEMFSRILSKSAESGEAYQMNIFQIVTAAIRPLTVDEVGEALSVVPGDDMWNPSTVLNDIDSALACCGCLILVDEEESTVRLAHHSVKQYLLDESGHSNKAFDISIAHSKLADICITYLNYGVFGTEISTSKVPEIAAAPVATRIVHSTMGSSSKTQSLALRLLRSRKQPDFDIGKTLAELRRPFRTRTLEDFCFYSYAKQQWKQHILDTTTLTPAMIKYIPKLSHRTESTLHVKNDQFRSLLAWGFNLEDSYAVKAILLGTTTAQESENWIIDFIQITASKGSERDIRILFENFYFKISVHDIWPAILAASDQDHVGIVRLLLDIFYHRKHDYKIVGKLQIDAVGKDFFKLLCKSLLRGEEEVQKLLIGIMMQENLFPGPLEFLGLGLHPPEAQEAFDIAVKKGNDRVVEELLDYFQPPRENIRLEAALFRASSAGYHTMVERLLPHINDCELDVILRCPALYTAAANGHEKVVTALLEKIRYSPATLDTALLASSLHGHATITQFLIESGANVNVRDANEELLIHLVWRNHIPEVAQVLLDNGADVMSPSRRNEYNALHHAIVTETSGPSCFPSNRPKYRSPLISERELEEGVVPDS